MFNPKSEKEQQYAKFRKRYRKRPGQFVVDCIIFDKDKHPDPYQLEILDALVSKKRVSCRGPHGLGKTALAAWAIIWFALVNDVDNDWKIPTTASAWRQLTKYLWPEVKKWIGKVDWEKVGREPFKENRELLSRSLKLKTGEAFAVASNDSNKIEGAHADKVLYIFDESKIIPEDTWDSAEGAMSSGDCAWLAISTPGEPIGRFYDIHSRKEGYHDWWVRHVTLDEFISTGRINAQWARDRALQWGEDSAVYKNRVRGEFAASEVDSVIPLPWIEAANERWLELMDKTGSEHLTIDQIGIDVARQGEDDSVFAFRSGDVIVSLETHHIDDTMKLVGQIIPHLRRHPLAHANVDVVGIGAGVYDRLRETYPDRIGYFNGRERTDMMDRSNTWAFVDKRSAAYWKLREALDPAYDSQVALPPDDKLTGELMTPKWFAMSNSRIQIEKKEDIKKRIQRSTDRSDAVAYAFWAEILGDIEFA